MNGYVVRRVILLCALLGVSCGKLHHPNLPWRTEDPATHRSANPDRPLCDPSSPQVPITLIDLGVEETQREIRCRTMERYRASDVHPAFDLHVIEFDDQGAYWDPEAARRSLDAIQQVREQGDVLIVMFLHGWFNHGDVCNGKLRCFRELLALLARAEEQHAELRSRAVRAWTGGASRARRVIGVYAAWRGGTIAVPGLKHVITFWGRKSAAHTIGENGVVTELVARLRGIAHPASQPSAAPQPGRRLVDDESTFIVAGHSFGGALLFSAVSNVLSSLAGDAMGVSRDAPVIEGPADLVIMINPAVEASRFDALRRTASRVRFGEQQVPVLLTLSSEKDSPNQLLFPLGQVVAFAQRAARSREQWLSMIESFGTFEPNHTHALIASGEDPPEPGRSGECQCEAGIASYAGLLLRDLRLQPVAVGTLDHATRRQFAYSRLEPIQDVDPNSPFLMVRVDGRVIGGHSDIFNQRIADFLVRFFVLNETKRFRVRLSRQLLGLS